MRRRIRLTGRKQIRKSSVSAEIIDRGCDRWIQLTIRDPQSFRFYPRNAKLKLRLMENKCSETVNFGSVGNPRIVQKLENHIFAAPSCQLRVVTGEAADRGRLLGSTDTWTLRREDPEDKDRKGILVFQAKDIRPEIWKLEFRDDDYPIVYVDSSIPNSTGWVRADPVFVGCVLPSIVRQVFEHIVENYRHKEDTEWIGKWLEWAGNLTGNPEKVPLATDYDKKQRWIGEIVESFCRKHKMIETLGRHVGGENDAQV